MFAKIIMLKYLDLELAYEFVNSGGGMFDNYGYVSKSTGKICYGGEGVDEELPEEILFDDDYVRIPERYDLDLGKQLVWDFVDREIPSCYEKVRRMFQR